MVSVIVPTVLHYKHGWGGSPYQIPTIIDPNDADYKDYNKWEYIKPWNRYSPYIIGVLLGYLLHETKGRQIKFSKVDII